MNQKLLVPALIALTLSLAACEDNKPDNLSGSEGGGNLPGDQLNMGIPQNARPDGNFNPETDVNYDTLVADTVYFAFDSSTVSASEREKLDQVRQWMEANPGHSLFLAGNADKRGTPEYNRALGERRALAVREYLVGLGLPASSLYTNSYGADRPAMEGDTEEAYAKNRRVEVGVIARK
jgi:peptidoglycan-associated lipoprotein